MLTFKDVILGERLERDGEFDTRSGQCWRMSLAKRRVHPPKHEKCHTVEKRDPPKGGGGPSRAQNITFLSVLDVYGSIEIDSRSKPDLALELLLFVLCSLFLVLCSLFFVLCSLFFGLRSLFFVLCSLFFGLRKLFSVLCSSFFVLRSLFFVLFSVFFVICSFVVGVVVDVRLLLLWS